MSNYSESTHILMSKVEREFIKAGSYEIFKLQAILENEVNIYSDKSMAMRKEINRLQNANNKSKRGNN